MIFDALFPQTRVVAGLILAFAFCGHAVAQKATPGAPTPPKQATWTRCVFDVPNSHVPKVKLATKTGKSRIVWLNGMRLDPPSIEAQSKTSELIQFDVSRLVRPGRNCLAIQNHSESTEPFVALQSGDDRSQKLSCRISSQQPPVGWQKTDFNDRDWKQTTILLADVNWNELKAIERNDTKVIRKEGQHFQDDDHVVLLGGTFFERAQQFGHLEAALMNSRARGVTFRNLGWSADTVFAESRGIFDSPAKGYIRMVEHLRAEQPDVVIVNYGQNEAMSDRSAEHLDRFKKQLRQLIADVRSTGAGVILVTPHPFLPMPEPLPDASTWNETLKQYAEVVKQTARTEACQCVDLWTDFHSMLFEAAASTGIWKDGLEPAEHPELQSSLFRRLTDNGMHWTDSGYRCLSLMVSQKMFQHSDQQQTRAKKRSGGPTEGSSAAAENDQLIALLVRKNELYFHRWRPQNITYLFGFRKHEQGNNAAEIAEFDPLIDELEQQVQSLIDRNDSIDRAEVKQ